MTRTLTASDRMGRKGNTQTQTTSGERRRKPRRHASTTPTPGPSEEGSGATTPAKRKRLLPHPSCCGGGALPAGGGPRWRLVCGWATGGPQRSHRHPNGPQPLCDRLTQSPTPAQKQLLSLLLPNAQIVNTHEHLMQTAGEGARLKLEAANRRSGVVSTALVASSLYTFTLQKGIGFIDHHKNNEYLCRLATLHPGEYYAFGHLRPRRGRHRP